MSLMCWLPDSNYKASTVIPLIAPIMNSARSLQVASLFTTGLIQFPITGDFFL